MYSECAVWALHFRPSFTSPILSIVYSQPTLTLLTLLALYSRSSHSFNSFNSLNGILASLISLHSVVHTRWSIFPVGLTINSKHFLSLSLSLYLTIQCIANCSEFHNNIRSTDILIHCTCDEAIHYPLFICIDGIGRHDKHNYSDIINASTVSSHHSYVATNYYFDFQLFCYLSFFTCQMVYQKSLANRYHFSLTCKLLY